MNKIFFSAKSHYFKNLNLKFNDKLKLVYDIKKNQILSKDF